VKPLSAYHIQIHKLYRATFKRALVEAIQKAENTEVGLLVYERFMKDNISFTAFFDFMKPKERAQYFGDLFSKLDEFGAVYPAPQKEIAHLVFGK